MLLFCDGFDHYSSAPGGTGLTTKWDAQGNNSTTSIQTAAARTGIQGLQITSFFGTQQTVQKFFANKVTVIVGFAVYFTTSGALNQNTGLCQVYDNGTIQVDVRMTPGGQLMVTRNGTTLGQSTVSMTWNNWHYIEFKATIDPSAGIAEVKMDGNFVIQLSGQNTRATANSQVNAFGIGFGGLASSSGPYTFFFDDVYLCDTTGSVNNNYLGDIDVSAVLPQANGTVNNFSQGGTTHPSNFQQVSENPPDGDVTYVLDGVPGDIDRYTYPAPRATSGTAYAAVVWNYARKDDAGARSIRASIKSGATTSDGGTDIPLQTNYAYYFAPFETDPNTSSAWTLSNMIAAEYGVKVTV